MLKNNFFALATLAIIIAAFYFKLFYPAPSLIITPDFGRSDSWHSSIADKFILFESLKQNQIPLWTDLLGNGYPLFAEGLVGALYLPNIIVFKFFSFVTAYNLAIVISALLWSIGFYIFYRYLSLSKTSSIFGAATLLFSGVYILQLTHVMVFESISLLPWLLVATLYLIKNQNKRSIVFLAFVLSQQILVGFPQTVFISILFSIFMLIWISRKSNKQITSFLLFTCSCVLAICLSAVQLLPSIEYLQNTPNPSGFDSNISTYFSYPWKHLITFINPYALGNPKFATYPDFGKFDGSIFWENTGYIGIIPLFLGMFAFLIRSRKHQLPSIFFLTTLIISLLLMTGKHSPAYLLFSFWPFTLFRVPSRFIILFVVSLTSLSVLGCDNLLRKKQRFINIGIYILVTINTLTLWSTWYEYHAISPASEWLTKPTYLNNIISDRVLTVGFEQKFNNDFLKYGWNDLKRYLFLYSVPTPNSNAYWNIQNASVYSGRQLQRPNAALSLLTDSIKITSNSAIFSKDTYKFAQLLGVNSIMSAYPITPESIDASFDLYVKTGSLEVLNNKNKTHRYYFAKHVSLANTYEEAEQKLLSKEFIADDWVLLEKPLTVAPNFTVDKIQTIENSPHQIQITVTNLSHQNLLVFKDTFYPGWNASIDGKETEIFAANIGQRAIIVPKGTHSISMYYLPKSFKFGSLISICSLAIVVILMVSAFAPLKTRKA